MFQLPERIRLDIKEPCSQQWESMPETRNGRFCSACSRNLIDFRDKSDAEIARIHLTSWGKVCGVYAPEQLTPFRTEEKRTRKGPVYWGLLGMLAAGSVNAQEAAELKTDQVTVSDDFGWPSCPKRQADDPIDRVAKQDSLFEARITLTILDPHDEPLPFALVHTDHDPKRYWTTDMDGQVHIRKSELEGDTVQFMIECIGFATYRIDNFAILDDPIINMTVNMREVMVTLGFAVTEPAQGRKFGFVRRAMWKLKGLFTRKEY